MSSIEIIYKYTETLIKEQESSLTRLDTKSTVLIAFAGTIAKIAIDIDSKSIVPLSLYGNQVNFRLSIMVYFFSAITVILASLGLTARARGQAVDPKELMEDEWFERDENMHQGYIISGWIATMEQYHQLSRKKIIRLNLTIVSLNIALITLMVIVIWMPNGSTSNPSAIINHL
jgi:hypothetical protein